MMRVTIIPADQFVSVNGDGCHGVDLSFLPSDVHAIQWFGTYGNVEYADDMGAALAVVHIDTLDEYTAALQNWHQRKETLAAELEAERVAEETARAEEKALREAQMLAEEKALREAQMLAEENAMLEEKLADEQGFVD